MERYFRDLIRFVEKMDSQEWVYVFIGALIVGTLCLRGFGSRSDY